jgi:hypothetical protein
LGYCVAVVVTHAPEATDPTASVVVLALHNVHAVAAFAVAM